MKKLIASLLCACMMSTLLVGCGGKTPEPVDGGTEAPADAESETPETPETPETTNEGGSGDASKTINVWAFTDEVPGMIEKYKEN